MLLLAEFIVRTEELRYIRNSELIDAANGALKFVQVLVSQEACAEAV
jgi:hypothetical protein